MSNILTAFVTEEEAAHKRCCGPENCGKSEHTAEFGQSPRFCVGSACMAWRWSEYQKSVIKSGGHVLIAPTGYCGVADEP